MHNLVSMLTSHFFISIANLWVFLYLLFVFMLKWTLYSPASSLLWKQKKTAGSRSLMLASPEILTAPCTTTFTGSPPTQTVTSTNALSITPASSHRSTAPSYNAPTPNMAQIVYPRNPPAQWLQSQQNQNNEACPKHRQGKPNSLHFSPLLLRRINSSAYSRKQASKSTTPLPTNFKDFSTHTRINRFPATEREYTGSLVSVAKSTSGNRTESPKKTERTLSTQPQRRFWEVSHCQALPHQGPPNRLAGSPTHHTYQLMAHQTHQRGHRNLQARHSSTGHRFLHQWYLATPTTDRMIFYIQSPQPAPDWGISYILSQPPSLPLCLLRTDSFSEHNSSPPTLQRSQSTVPPVSRI